jgi:AmmeMemoRadiSam system protein B
MCERPWKRWGAGALGLGLALVQSAACGSSEPDESGDTGMAMPEPQPGADDPTARQMEKAGAWYPEDPDVLDTDVSALLDAIGTQDVRDAYVMLTPHASLKFSGPTAAEAFARVAIPDRVILLSPDHWGGGAPAAVWNEGPWLVPGHAIKIDHDIVAELTAALPDLAPDRVPFSNHEEEMQLPFLQLLHPGVTIAPIAIFDNSRNHFKDLDVARVEEWGAAIAGVIRAHAEAGEHVMLLTTTDLVHHEEVALADEQDPALMSYVSALDVEGLHAYVTDNEVSICGEIPTSIMMVVARELGATGIEIIARGNSLHANPDEADVIGYPAAAAWME